MNALRSVHDGVDLAVAAPATIMKVKAGAVQKGCRDRVDFPEAGGAAARQARVTRRYAGSVDEQSAYSLDERRLHRVD